MCSFFNLSLPSASIFLLAGGSDNGNGAGFGPGEVQNNLAPLADLADRVDAVAAAEGATGRFALPTVGTADFAGGVATVHVPTAAAANGLGPIGDDAQVSDFDTEGVAGCVIAEASDLD